MLVLDSTSTALILIDLQNGIVGMPLEPRSGRDVVAGAKDLAAAFRKANAGVILVRVGWAADFGDSLRQPVDQPAPRPAGGMPAGWAEYVEGLAQPSDLLITKRQWGAFYGTELDLQLRRRNIQTVVVGGIATNFGVDSTARQAWERGYNVVIAEDICASRTLELHEMAVRHIFPRIARVVRVAELSLSPAVGTN